jgi:hypothetical protein
LSATATPASTRTSGIGPISAVGKALAQAGLTVEQLDVIESNEAFAAQACAVSKELQLDPAKVHPNGVGGDRLGPSDFGHRCDPHGQSHCRTAAHRRALYSRHDVH